MYGYKVFLNGLPKTEFACTAVVDDYQWKNLNKKNTIEISIVDAREMSQTVNNETHFFDNQLLLSCIMGNEKSSAFARRGVRNEITTVAVSFEEIDIVPCELKDYDADNNEYYLFPAYSTDTGLIREITPLLNQYIKFNTTDKSCDRAFCISRWFEILSCIDKYMRRTLRSKGNGFDNYYVKKLDHIIRTKYGQKLSLTKIAGEFGVSMSYLSSVYSRATGKNFKEALNSERMRRAKELLLNSEMKPEEVAHTIGLCDEVYLRKAFKKFYGVGISDFVKIARGMTLYHEKPLRKKEDKT